MTRVQAPKTLAPLSARGVPARDSHSLRTRAHARSMGVRFWFMHVQLGSTLWHESDAGRPDELSQLAEARKKSDDMSDIV